MKERCFIHIGMHKTGSSSIQRTLYKQRSLLIGENYTYVDLGVPNLSNRMRLLFGEQPDKYNNNFIKGLNKEKLRERKQELENAFLNSFTQENGSNFIISGEGISRFSVTELTSMKDLLNKYFKRVVIIGYVRPPLSYIQSRFQQKLKGGLSAFDLDKRYPKYRNLFEKFDQVFGQENVDLRKFDPKIFPEGNVVLDFCHSIGIAMLAENTIRVNDSLSLEAASLLYLYNKFRIGSSRGLNTFPENKVLIDELNKIGKTKFKLSPYLIQSILDKNREDIEWMEARLGQSLTENVAENGECIRNEGDLINTPPDIINELKLLIGDGQLIGGAQGTTPEEVAELIHLLKTKLTSPIVGKKKSKEKIQLTTLHIAKQIQEVNKDELGTMNENRIASIISAALTQIKSEIETTDRNVVMVPELGVFNIRRVEQDKERQKAIAKRTIFKIEIEKKRK